VDNAERHLREGDGMAGGQVLLGALPTIAPFLLPRILRRFTARHADVEITVHEDLTQHLLEGLVAGELDLALAALPIQDGRLHVEPLFTEPLLLAMPLRHRLLRRRRITLNDLQQERFILLNEMHCLGEQILSFCRANECHPRVACRSAQISTVQKMIALGQGISLLPEMALKGETPRLAHRRLADTDPVRTIAIVRHKYRSTGPAVQRFLDCLRNAVAR
jgi:LysR family hydrogen peroxide-inducible transcriptional activator